MRTHARSAALLAAVAALAGVTLLAGRLAPARAAASSQQRQLTIYAVTTGQKFVNHADDRERGNAKNPFNADTPALATKSNAREKGKGPFPGDNVLYSFKLYSGTSRKHSIGTGTYSCTYGFDKQALCEAFFDISGGSLIASGPVDFSSTDTASFTLAVTGGTGKFLGYRGQVASNPAAAKNTQRLDFSFG